MSTPRPQCGIAFYGATGREVLAPDGYNQLVVNVGDCYIQHSETGHRIPVPIALVAGVGATEADLDELEKAINQQPPTQGVV